MISQIPFLKLIPNVFGNLPIESVALTTWFSCILFLISFCLWQDLSINDFFLFANASCKLPGAGVNFERVSGRKKVEAIFTSLSNMQAWNFNLSRELPLALGFTDPFQMLKAYLQILQLFPPQNGLVQSFLFLVQEAEIHSPNCKKVTDEILSIAKFS